MKGIGCFGIIVVLVIIGFVVGSCQSLFGITTDEDRMTTAHVAVHEKVSGSFCYNDKVTHLTDVDQYMITGCIDDNAGEDYYRVVVDSSDNVVSVELASGQ